MWCNVKRLAAVAMLSALALGALATPAEAGRDPCPGVAVARVQAYSVYTFRETFRGGELAEIRMVGDGDTRLDVYIYDENGNLIKSAVGPGDNVYLNWTPRWTGRFRIEVHNLGGVWNEFRLTTN